MQRNRNLTGNDTALCLQTSENTGPECTNKEWTSKYIHEANQKKTDGVREAKGQRQWHKKVEKERQGWKS